MIIVHATTSDGPDGRPWPPTESNVLWVIVARADGRTHWRAIELASPALPRTLQFPDGQQTEPKR
jgi:hypothetical protein